MCCLIHCSAHWGIYYHYLHCRVIESGMCAHSEHPICLELLRCQSTKNTKLVALGLSPGTGFLVKQMGIFLGCWMPHHIPPFWEMMRTGWVSPEAVPWQQLPFAQGTLLQWLIELGDLPEICSCMHVWTHWFTHLLTIMHFQEFSFIWKSYFWAVIEHLKVWFPWLANVFNGRVLQSHRTAQQALTYQEHEEHVLSGGTALWISNPGILNWSGMTRVN